MVANVSILWRMIITCVTATTPLLRTEASSVKVGLSGHRHVLMSNKSADSWKSETQSLLKDVYASVAVPMQCGGNFEATEQVQQFGKMGRTGRWVLIWMPLRLLWSESNNCRLFIIVSNENLECWFPSAPCEAEGNSITPFNLSHTCLQTHLQSSEQAFEWQTGACGVLPNGRSLGEEGDAYPGWNSSAGPFLPRSWTLSFRCCYFDDCVYTITSPPGTMVHLQMHEYSQYFSKNCTKVTFTVYDGE